MMYFVVNENIQDKIKIQIHASPGSLTCMTKAF